MKNRLGAISEAFNGEYLSRMRCWAVGSRFWMRIPCRLPSDSEWRCLKRNWGWCFFVWEHVLTLLNNKTILNIHFVALIILKYVTINCNNMIVEHLVNRVVYVFKMLRNHFWIFGNEFISFLQIATYLANWRFQLATPPPQSSGDHVEKQVSRLEKNLFLIEIKNSCICRLIMWKFPYFSLDSD